MSLTRVSPALFQVSNNITSVTVGGSANTISLTFDSNGIITGASNNALSVANTAITGLIQAAQIGSANATLVTSGTLPAAALPAGSVLQVKNLQTGAVATGTTPIPFDDTIPQITEGNQYLSLAITPISATSKLLICVVATAGSSVVSQWMTSALFQDSTANALAVNSVFTPNVTAFAPCVFNYFMTSGTTSSTTFTVRSGSHDAGTTTFNGQSAARRFGGVLYSSITITEIAA